MPVEEGCIFERSKKSIITAACIWLLVVCAGSLLMAQYSLTAGDAGAPPRQWPQTCPVPGEPGMCRLVMFIHPHCPCSRATLGELERLMARSQGLLTAQVWFIQPEGFTEEWARTDLWSAARVIPGVMVYVDHSGSQARLFHAMTSGQTLVYDAGGRLVYQGGITLARGHAGDNPGREAIEAFLKTKTVVSASSPVFGCALSRDNSTEKCTLCQPQP